MVSEYKEVRFVLWNCNGMKHEINANGVKTKVSTLEWIKSECEGDVAILTETHLPHILNDRHTSGSSMGESRRGTGVFSLNPKIEIEHLEGDKKGRWNECRIVGMGLNLKTKVVYAPNNPKERREWLGSNLEPNKMKSLDLLAGDFNTILNHQQREPSSENTTSLIGRDEILEMVRVNNLTNLEDSGKWVGTMLSHSHANRWSKWQSTIDHLFTSRKLTKNVANVEVYKGVTEWGHKPICITIRAGEKKFKSELKKVNRSTLLQDNWKYPLAEWKDKVMSSPLSKIWKWRWIKKGAIQILSELQMKLNREKINYKKEMKRLLREGVLDKDPSSLRVWDENKKESNEMKRIQIGLLKRKELVHPSRALTRLLKARQRDNEIESVLDDNGILFSSNGDIKRIFVKHFENQFNDVKTKKEVRMKMLRNRKKPNIHFQSLNFKISRDEVERAIMNTNPTKAPGRDGLTGEFYHINKDWLIPILTDVYNEFLDGEEIPVEMKSGIIHLLSKPGKDPKYPANKRPIALLNVDYKLFYFFFVFIFEDRKSVV